MGVCLRWLWLISVLGSKATFDAVVCRLISWLALQTWLLFKDWSSSLILVSVWHIWLTCPDRSDTLWLMVCMLSVMFLWIVTSSWQNCLNSSVCWICNSKKRWSKLEPGGLGACGRGGLKEVWEQMFGGFISWCWLIISEKVEEWSKDGIDCWSASSVSLCSDKKRCFCVEPGTSSPSSAWNRKRNTRLTADKWSFVCL